MQDDELDMINTYFNISPLPQHVRLGIGDDAAIHTTPAGFDILTSIDTSVMGQHFLEKTPPYDIGHKSLAVSLSDMAAMGATPDTTLLSLSLPHMNKAWLKDFSAGFLDLAKRYDVTLIGGDTTKGPLSITTVLQGYAPQGQAITRSGAKVADLLCVTQTIGDAGYARFNPHAPSAMRDQLNRPIPLIEFGIALRGIATSAIDVSDGLAMDIARLTQASQVGAHIKLGLIPLSPDLPGHIDNIPATEFALSAGDDYQLCFTIPPDRTRDLQAISQKLQTPCHVIGEMTEHKEVIFLNNANEPVKIQRWGYTHF